MIEYDPHDWWGHFLDIQGSMVREIIARVAGCMLWTAAVVAAYQAKLIPDVPATAHQLIGTALGLLLVFRTNSSYDRFWEGRRQWGGLVNDTRNLARMAKTLLAGDRKLADRIVHWTVAFCWATMNSLRGLRALGPVDTRLPAEEAASVLASRHVPLAISNRLGELLRDARQAGLISDIVQMELERIVQRMVDAMGACERIKLTPMPFAYAVHLRRALVVYCLTLPFGLVRDFGWGAILATLLITYTLFGIEEIGVEIENPFGFDDNDLPLEQICDSIEKNLLDLIDNPRGSGQTA